MEPVQVWSEFQPWRSSCPSPCCRFQGLVGLRVKGLFYREGPLGIHFLKTDANQTGNLHDDHFGESFVEQQLPNIGVNQGYVTCIYMYICIYVYMYICIYIYIYI